VGGLKRYLPLPDTSASTTGREDAREPPEGSVCLLRRQGSDALPPFERSHRTVTAIRPGWVGSEHGSRHYPRRRAGDFFLPSWASPPYKNLSVTMRCGLEFGVSRTYIKRRNFPLGLSGVTLPRNLIQVELESGLLRKGQAMKRKRFTEEQIIGTLGLPEPALCA
jgi:hypothetical protein